MGTRMSRMISKVLRRLLGVSSMTVGRERF
jgi:hypothetical protein